MYLTRTAGIETYHTLPAGTGACPNVSYPHCGNWNCVCPGRLLAFLLMYLTRTAGIETFISFPEVFMAFKCILPALRELKLQFGFHSQIPFILMYLTRTAGIFAFYSPIKNTSFGGTHRPEWRVFCSFFFILLVYEKKPPSCEEG